MILDVPEMKVCPNAKRYLLPKILLLALLGILLYAGVYANYYLLQQSVPALWNGIIIAGIIMLIILEMILGHVRINQYIYVFYAKKLIIVESVEEILPYDAIRTISLKENMFDKMYHTGTIIIKTNGTVDRDVYKLRHIPKPNEVLFYLQKAKSV
jgi:hypothetical protein